MGALLAFPAVYRDYTGSFTELEQQPIRSLPKGMRTVVRSHEKAWDTKLQENIEMLWESVHVLDEVHPFVWIGTADAAVDDAVLEENSISVVLNMAKECDYKIDLPMTKLIKIGINDGRLTNVGVFEKAAEVIADAVNKGENILVHCAAGVSKSCAAVIAYLMLYKDLGWSDSLEGVREHRPCVNPHPLLVRSLIRDFKDRFVP